MSDFTGSISDLGCPTANQFGTSCGRLNKCSRRDCLFPKACRHLEIDESAFIALLKAVESAEGIRHLFVSSGLRMKLLLRTPVLLEKILRDHTPGALKIAP